MAFTWLDGNSHDSIEYSLLNTKGINLVVFSHRTIPEKLMHPSVSGIYQVQIQQDRLKAAINLPDANGVFLVSVSTPAHQIIHRRFVEFTAGDNSLELITGFLGRGQYILSVVRENLFLNQVFSV